MDIAIITGASSGMGREFFKQITQKYTFDEVWVIARRLTRLQELQELTTIKVVPISIDLSKKENISVLEEKLLAEKPNVKLLINASGYGRFGKFEDITKEDNIGMIELNDIALINMTYTVLPYIGEGGKILNIGSLASFEPIPHINVYAATKAFVLSFSRALNRELKSRKIHVLCLCPYWTKTEFFDRANTDSYIKKFDIVYECEYVVKKGINALYNSKRDYIVPGKYASFIRFLSKFLPHRFIMFLIEKTFKFKN